MPECRRVLCSVKEVEPGIGRDGERREHVLPAAQLGCGSNKASHPGNFRGFIVEFITTYVLPPIFLGFLVSLGIIGVRNLKLRMSGGKSAESAPSGPDGPKVSKARENKRVCANGHAKAGNQKFCDECGR